ncbi:hypothetical protein BpOF4_10085 [Alkalihalophilus pseudofirmus OF4]|uniref:Cytochrome-c oxidase n=1 Tax=Alkalihalophilus pseudofirmus (strain ATCC BAA-2126 / JCM 17055 / OF4) TaxID=398511 RepID=D3FTJ9_ALKPO|nr:hypothetical protein [Alkalihalophilus pseudofirmus]ADC50072.1 hypothetical protein BpOF4_10085 [Alkalihalophilus pseudofirmus OF4]
MNKTKVLLRFSALYALIGTFLGSHMAGAGSMLFRAIHAHILLVGWLSLFAFAIFYAVFAIPKHSKLAKTHVWTALIGSFGLTFGMWMHYFKPDWAPETFSLIFYIVGGTVLIISFGLFAVMTFVYGRYFGDRG